MGRRYHSTPTIDDAEVTHKAPELIVNIIAHLHQVAIVFGSSLLSRVTSHDEGPFSLELPLLPSGVSPTFPSASGSRPCPESAEAVLDEYREAVMTRTESGRDGGW